VSLYLLDTDTFSHYLRHNPAVIRSVASHLSDRVAISIITAQEVWDGWAGILGRAKTPAQVAAAYSRLTETLDELKNWSVVPFREAAVIRYAGLKKQRLNVGANDLKIASIALESGAVVVTANVRDFRRIPGVNVEDWTSE
jgi:tRNA(fMet)-specific endonuclease VapC